MEYEKVQTAGGNGWRQESEDGRRIIAFRNILAHGYAQIDDHVVWDILESKLPALRREVDALLEEQ